MEEIEKDIKRTRVELHFFYTAVDRARTSKADIERLEKQAQTSRIDLTRDQLENYIDAHIDCLSRILFIWAKLNRGVSYVQGMNEVIAVLYYSFWQDGDNVISPLFFESDLFFCFSCLMSELKDGFMRDLDKEGYGVQGKFRQIEEIVSVVDQPVYEALLVREKVET